MTTTTAKIADQALALPCDERIALVDQLLASLNSPGSAELEQAWIDEIENRIDQIDQGTVELIPGDEVMAEMRKRFGR